MQKDLKAFRAIIRCAVVAGLNTLFVINVFSQTSPLLIAPLFQDNMVLQQQRDVPVWGKGTP